MNGIDLFRVSLSLVRMNSEAEEGAGPGHIPVPWIGRDGGPGREMRIPAVYPEDRPGVKVEPFSIRIGK